MAKTKIDKHNQKKKKSSKYEKSKCRMCNGQKGMIYKYNLRVCRRCFKDFAREIGFTKFN